jgi:ribose transport system ATP-binding protein
VYQELSLIPNLSVAHNLFLTEFPRGRSRLLSTSAANEAARRTLSELHLDDIDPCGYVADLPLDRQQMLEIAKALLRKPRILILDEATSSLSAREVDRLLELVAQLKAAGTTVVMISHRMDEIWRLADEFTILRDGRTVARGQLGDVSPTEAVRLMAGRDVQTAFPAKPQCCPTETALEVRGVKLTPGAGSWNLSLRKGEVLGLGGLEGQGQREFLRWLYGQHPAQGAVLRNGRSLRVRRPKDALKAGIVYIPEDRKAEALHLDLPVRWNIAMATLPQRSLLGFIRLREERKLAAEVIDRLSIKVDSSSSPVSRLSGGTQQKVVLGKFMTADPDVLLFMDPTRGIDVHTKFEFYELIRGLTAQGKSCIVYSSDTAELAGIADRVAVFHSGAVAAVLEGDSVTQEAIVAASFAVTGGTE